MNLDRSLEQAHHVRGHRRAAVLYNSIEYELVLGEPTAAQETQGERALARLEQRFPGVKTAAREVDQPPGLSRRAGARLRDGADAGDPRHAPRDALSRGGGRSRQGHRLALRTLELGAFVAVVAAGAALLWAAIRRHPRHAVAGGVVALAIATGRPSIIGTACVIAAMIWAARRGGMPRAPRPPRLPAPPRPPTSLRAPRAPRWPR
jgi:hypothetical protein